MKYLALLLVLSTGCVTVERNIKYEDLNDYVAKSFAKARAIEYKSDIQENWQFPLETKKLGTGDCEDKAFYLEYLFSKYDNIKSRVVTGYPVTEDPWKDFNEKDKEKQKPLHVWNEVTMGGATYVLDPTSGCFRDKKTLTNWYQWDITQDPRIFVHYSGQIRWYVKEAKRRGHKKFADRVSESFKVLPLSQTSSRQKLLLDQ